MSTSTIRIDDRDGSISYSRPASGGHWSNQSSRVSDAFQSTLKLTRTRNASATVSFRGTSITVVGVIEDGGSSSTSPSSSYQIDGGGVKVYNGVLSGNDRYHVEFFKSDPLPMGQHTLVIRNLAEGSFFWLDEFIITQGPEIVVVPVVPPSPSPSPTTTTTIPRPAQTTQTGTITATITVRPDTSTSTSTSASDSPGTTVVVQGSSTRTIVLTETTLTTSPTQNPLPSSSNGIGAGSAGNNVGGDVFGVTSREKAPVPLGAIIGGVLGGLAFILGILVFFMWRRQRSRRKGDNNMGQVPTSWGSSRRSQLISPFSASATRPSMSQFQGTVPSSGISMSEKEDSSPTAALVTRWRETLGMDTAAVGKRQLAAMDANAGSPPDIGDRLPSYLPNGRLRAGEHVLDATLPSFHQKS